MKRESRIKTVSCGTCGEDIKRKLSAIKKINYCNNVCYRNSDEFKEHKKVWW